MTQKLQMGIVMETGFIKNNRWFFIWGLYTSCFRDIIYILFHIFHFNFNYLPWRIDFYGRRNDYCGYAYILVGKVAKFFLPSCYRHSVFIDWYTVYQKSPYNFYFINFVIGIFICVFGKYAHRLFFIF